MEKRSEEVIEVIEKHHTFYCDRCECLLGDTVEDHDGFYDSFGEYESTAFLDGICGKSRWVLKQNLCNKCKEKLALELEQTLLRFGFMKD